MHQLNLSEATTDHKQQWHFIQKKPQHHIDSLKKEQDNTTGVHLNTENL